MEHLICAICVVVSMTAVASAQTAEAKPISRSLLNRAMSILPDNGPLIRELELLDYQLEAIDRLRSDFPEKLRAKRLELIRSRESDRQGELDSVFTELETQISQTLVPEQLRRWQQIALQSFAVSPIDGSLDVSRLLSLRPVRDELELSDDDIRKLKQLAQAEKEELEETIRRLRRKSSQRLLATLDAEQRKRLDAMVGKLFDFEGHVPQSNGTFRKLGSGNDDH